MSSVLGPVVGGFIVTAWGWPWVFLINVPVGLVAMAIVAVYLREPVRAAGHGPRLDIAGAITLTLGTTAALVALSLLSNGARLGKRAGAGPAGPAGVAAGGSSSPSSAAPPSRWCRSIC